MIVCRYISCNQVQIVASSNFKLTSEIVECLKILNCVITMTSTLFVACHSSCKTCNDSSASASKCLTCNTNSIHSMPGSEGTCTGTHTNRSI